jgi:hypothetical protein
MSTRIQRANNKVQTAAVAIGYAPNKTVLSPTVSSLSGLNISANLQVQGLTAFGSFRTNQIYADSIIVGNITTSTILTGSAGNTQTGQLTADSIITDDLYVKNYIYGTPSKLQSGIKFGEANKIDFSFVNNNKVYILGKDNTLKNYIKIFDVVNIYQPGFVLSSYAVAPGTTNTQFAFNPETNYLYYTSLDPGTGFQEIYAYNLNTQNTPLSTAKTRFTSNIGTPEIKKLFINNNYLYAQVNDPSILAIFNITNPSTITFTGSCNLLSRDVVGIYNNHVITKTTTLTSGGYKDLVGLIDTVTKQVPYILNEVPLDDVGSTYTNVAQYDKYLYRTAENYSTSASRIYFYDLYNFFKTPFVSTLSQIVSTKLQGYENLGNKNLSNGRLYIASTGQTIEGSLNQYPKGYSVWDFTNIYQPASAYFWNDTENDKGPGKIIYNSQGALLAETSTLSSLQIFYTYNANFDSARINQIYSNTFETYALNTENISYINATGGSLTATSIKSNDVLPVLPVPRILLSDTTQLHYATVPLGTTNISAAGAFTLERAPKLQTCDLTQETLGKYKIFLEMGIFKKRKRNVPKGRLKSNYSFVVPDGENSTIMNGHWTRSSNDQYNVTSNIARRTNYVEITALNRIIDISHLLDLHLKESLVAFLPTSATSVTDYDYLPLLRPFGYDSGANKVLSSNPRYPYARVYRPLYVAFRYIAWLPDANNSKGQVLTGPLSPTIRIANKYFPFYTDHYASSMKGFPVASISPYYQQDLNLYKNTFTCKFN